MTRTSIVVLLLVTISTFWVAEQSWADASCSKDDALLAEQEAASLTEWRTVYGSYVKYHQCDDGSIAEGYSESVSMILADRWPQIDDLAKMIQKDKNFRPFVLRHLDESVPSGRLRIIESNARNQCPQKHRALCDLILRSIPRLPSNRPS